MAALTKGKMAWGIGVAGLALVAAGCGKPAEAPANAPVNAPVNKSAASASAPVETSPAPAGSGETAAAPVAGDLEVRQARAILTPSMGAVYLTVTNRGTRGDRLLRVESSIAEAAEAHESREEKGVVKMVAHPEGFEIPAGGTLELQPGGKHIMLVAPRAFAASGGTIPLTLHFEHAGAVEVRAKVAAPGEGAERP